MTLTSNPSSQAPCFELDVEPPVAIFLVVEPFAVPAAAATLATGVLAAAAWDAGTFVSLTAFATGTFLGGSSSSYQSEGNTFILSMQGSAE